MRISPAEAFGVGATILSLVAMGYGFGVWLERRRRADKAVLAALTTVKKALGSIDFQELTIFPDNTVLGSEIVLQYIVENRLRVPIEIWLGADIPLGGDSYFYDISQDKTVTLEPGRHIYERSLTLASPLPVGDWTLSAGIWFGKRSIPEQSIRLAVRTTNITVTSR